MRIDDEVLAEQAVERGWLSSDQLSKAIRTQQRLLKQGRRCRLSGVLVAEGHLSRAQVHRLRGTGATGLADEADDLADESGGDASGGGAGVSPAAGAAVRTGETPMSRPAPARRGVKIPGYRVVRKLGEGAMGQVFKAVQESVQRPVAIKVLGRRYQRDRKLLERFMREARMTARLNHENVIAGIDFGSVDGLHYFVMEYVEGETLAGRLAHRGRLGEAEALDIALQMARALDHAHGLSMVHRDIKPENIMIDEQGVAKLCDLGLAKDTSVDSSLTQSGTTVGTPHYIAPEQARGEADVDIRADLYALGATLYHLVTGRTPFLEKQATVVMMKHLHEEPPAPRELVPELSEGCALLIGRLMAKDRNDRLPTPAEVAAAIEALQRGEVPAILRAPPGAADRAGASADPDPAAERRAGAGRAARPPRDGRPGAARTDPRPAWAGSAPVRALLARLAAPLRTTRPATQMALGAALAVLLLATLAGTIALLIGPAETLPPAGEASGPRLQAPDQEGAFSTLKPEARSLSAPNPKPPLKPTVLSPQVSSLKPHASAPEADRALEAAQFFAEQFPDDFAGALERLAAVVERFPGTAAAEDAQQARARLMERARATAAVEQQELEQRWRRQGLEEAGRWGLLIQEAQAHQARFAFLPEVGARLAPSLADWRRRLDERFTDDLRRVDALAEEARAAADSRVAIARFKEASALLQGVPEYGTAVEIRAAEERSRRLRDEVSRVLQEQEARRRAAEQQYPIYWQERERALLAGDLALARSLADATAARAELSSLAAWLDEDRAELALLARAGDFLRAGLDRWRRDRREFPYSNRPARLLAVSEAHAVPWRYDTPDWRLELEVRIDQLPVRQTLRLSQWSPLLLLDALADGGAAIEPDQGRRAATVGMAACYFTPAGVARFARAEPLLETAFRAGQVSPRLMVSFRENFARASYEAVRATLAADSPAASAAALDEAQTLLDPLRLRLADTGFARGHAAEIARLAAELRARRAPPERAAERPDREPAAPAPPESPAAAAEEPPADRPLEALTRLWMEASLEKIHASEGQKRAVYRAFDRLRAANREAERLPLDQRREARERHQQEFDEALHAVLRPEQLAELEAMKNQRP